MIDDQIEDLNRTIDAELKQGGYPAAVIQGVTAYLQTFSEDVAAVLNGSGYEEFLASYISAEQAAFKDPEGGRTQPLCTCDSAFCSLKEGRLPVRIRRADKLDREIERWAQDHAGHPTVLDDAREEWAQTRAEVYNGLRIALTALRQNQRVETFEDRPRFEVPDAQSEEAAG